MFVTSEETRVYLKAHIMSLHLMNVKFQIQTHQKKLKIGGEIILQLNTNEMNKKIGQKLIKLRIKSYPTKSETAKKL